jgi:hypothetical protein
MLGGITADGWEASCFTHLVGSLLFTLHGWRSISLFVGLEYGHVSLRGECLGALRGAS